MKRKMPPDDRIMLFERLLMGPEETGAESVDMPTDLCRYVLEAAKRAPLPRGGVEKRGREIVRQAVAISRARARKDQLQAEGKSAEDALWQAAEEAHAKDLTLLTVSTIVRRMQSKPSRR